MTHDGDEAPVTLHLRLHVFISKKLPFPRTDPMLAVERVLPDGGGDTSHRKAGNIKVVTKKKSWLQSAASPGPGPASCHGSSTRRVKWLLIDKTSSQSILLNIFIGSCPDARPPPPPSDLYWRLCLAELSIEQPEGGVTVFSIVRQFWHRCKKGCTIFFMFFLLKILTSALTLKNVC